MGKPGNKVGRGKVTGKLTKLLVHPDFKQCIIGSVKCEKGITKSVYYNTVVTSHTENGYDDNDVERMYNRILNILKQNTPTGYIPIIDIQQSEWRGHQSNHTSKTIIEITFLSNSEGLFEDLIYNTFDAVHNTLQAILDYSGPITYKPYRK